MPDEWGGMSLGDALAPRRGGGQADAQRQQPPARPFQDPRDEDARERDAFAGPGDDFETEVLVPPRPPPGWEAAWRGGGGGGGPDAWRSPPPGGRSGGAPGAAEDAWGGQSLGDALAPKRAAPPPAAASGGGSSGSRGAGARHGGRPGPGAPPAGAADCDKSPEEVVKWVQSLPESHVPEKARGLISAIVEEEGLGGAQFSQYVLQVPPEVCAPKHAMKLKAAWANVLKEAAAREVALSNLANQPKQKATMIVV